jgi:uncharacterized membrane protein
LTDGRLRAATAVLALAGAGIAAYLVYARYSGGAIACFTGGCETVQRSSYSELAGIPVAILGLAAYVTVFALALVPGEPARAALLALVLAGVAFSGYLLWAQAGPIGAFCLWCLASDAIMSALAILTLLRVVPVRFPAWTSWSSTQAPRA